MRIQFNNGETRLVAKVSNSTVGLATTTPLTVKNQFREYQINSIQDLPDVSEVNVANGSTMVYNSNSSLYEIKKLNITDIDGAIDEGEF